MLSLLAKSCIDRGTTNSWSLLVREHVLTMNTKIAKINAYTPAQLMLGFEPQQYHFSLQPVTIPDVDDAEMELPEHEYNLFVALRDEDRLLASETASYTHGYVKARERHQRIPEPGDLVLVRNHTVYKQKGRKLDPSWEAWCGKGDTRRQKRQKILDRRHHAVLPASSCTKFSLPAASRGLTYESRRCLDSAL